MPVAVLAAGAVSDAGAVEPLRLTIPALTGKSEVGTRSFELIDRSRPAGFGNSGHRRLMGQVTYPRTGAGGCRNAPYMPPQTEDVLLSFLSLSGPVTGITRTCVGGAVAGRRLPLLVFSHAYTADRAVYTALIADLASRGFVVAAVDHTYDAFAVKFPTGPVVRGLFGSPLASKPISGHELASLVAIRTADVRFATTELLAQSRSRGNWLSGRIDPARIGAFGHSLGGATALRVATLDRRFRASADLDGSLFGTWPLTVKSRKPLLLLVAGGGLGEVLPHDKACRFFASAAPPKFAWQMTGAKHLAFSDFQTLAPQIAAARPDWPFATLYQAVVGGLDPAASIAAQRATIARFFTAYLGVKRVKAPTPPPGVQPVAAADLACVS